MITPRKRAATLRALAMLGALAAFAPSVAEAQRGIDTQLFHPALDSYGIFSVERAETSHQWDFGFKFYLNFGGSPLRLDMYDAATMMPKQTSLMDYQVTMNFGVHLGLTNWLELVADLPISAQSYTSAYGTNISGASDLSNGVPSVLTGFYAADGRTNINAPNAAPLDARLGLKAKLFRKGFFGMALAAVVTVPFGDDSAFLGDTNFTFRPTVIADFTRGPLTVAVNLGAIIRQTTSVFDPHDVALNLPNPRLLMDLGHELTWSAGLAYRIVHWVGLAAELYGYSPLVGKTKDNTADVLGGVQIFPTKDVVVAVGAGGDVFSSAHRHDLFRVFAGVSWAPSESAKGVAAGGIDSDGDGIPDAQDLCPNEPEDKDGFDDEDGCPDPDNDQDGIPDKLDKCPNEPEDKDGFQDDDGCPDPDNDQDGVPDAQDKCPNDPEDRDGFQDDDGCPDADNDGDGIPDVVDKCPNEPETRNGVDDEDGCPDSGGVAVAPAGKIDLPETVAFDASKATVNAKAAAVLDRVADKLKANAGVKRIRIEGHSDDPGGKAKNQTLSQQRAEAVMEYLIKKGVERERLQAVGYGESRPVDKRNSAEARAKNRRVEFIIVEQ